MPRLRNESERVYDGNKGMGSKGGEAVWWAEGKNHTPDGQPLGSGRHGSMKRSDPQPHDGRGTDHLEEAPVRSC